MKKKVMPVPPPSEPGYDDGFTAAYGVGAFLIALFSILGCMFLAGL